MKVKNMNLDPGVGRGDPSNNGSRRLHSNLLTTNGNPKCAVRPEERVARASRRMKCEMARNIWLGLVFLGFTGLFAQQQGTSWRQEFFQSFISHYECNPDGRYTHEYHPFLLQQTAKSLDLLEQRLKDEKLALDGRLVIA
ncbi:MAG: hypothetical protein WCT20_03885, partial [Candidatus Babeliales bacterium]